MENIREENQSLSFGVENFSKKIDIDPTQFQITYAANPVKLIDYNKEQSLVGIYLNGYLKWVKLSQLDVNDSGKDLNDIIKLALGRLIIEQECLKVWLKRNG